MEIKLAKAPIAWTNDDLPQLGKDTPVETCLSEIRQAGFVGTELGGKFPKDKKQLKEILNKFDLELAGGWFSGFLLTNSLKKEIERLEKEIQRRSYVGCNIIVYCECSNTIQGNIDTPLSKKPILSKEQMKEYAQNFSRLTAYAKEKNVILAYHHHMGTIIQTEEEIDSFLFYASEDVGLTYDTGHIYFAGGNPLKVLKKHKDRILHVHFKDVRKKIRIEVIKNDKSFLNAVLDGVYTIPGDGIIDFKDIIEVLREIDYKGWIVVEAEQDPAKANPLECAISSYKYLNTILYKGKL